MVKNKRFINEMTRMYDHLIAIGKKNIGKQVVMDFGTWTPSEKGIETMQSRRDKIYYGR
tara:strand:+ start:3046 stop:3222 length:177 start_codon:yes stop_codon:yes gene_type:complete